ncbi:winged helix-turn-helix domain-containing protein [Deinococcus koreensis]|nr:winged helix-turn-helix domain-containing protein [Deinococcus koreensis]
MPDTPALPPLRHATAAQAALLLDVGLRALLGLLMTAPRTVTEVAAALDISPNRAQYLVGKLHRADIAVITATQPRAGRGMRRYGVTPRWFIPFEVTGAETLDAFLAAQLVPRVTRMMALTAAQMRAHADTWGYWLEQHDETGSNLRLGDERGQASELFGGPSPLMANIGTLTLTARQAQALKARVIALFNEVEPPEVGGECYSVAVLLVRGEVE